MPVKGTHCWFNPEVIYITTNLHPRDWYKWTGREEQEVALRERFQDNFHVFRRRENARNGATHVKVNPKDFWPIASIDNAKAAQINLINQMQVQQNRTNIVINRDPNVRKEPKLSDADRRLAKDKNQPRIAQQIINIQTNNTMVAAASIGQRFEADHNCSGDMCFICEEYRNSPECGTATDSEPDSCPSEDGQMEFFEENPRFYLDSPPSGKKRSFKDYHSAQPSTNYQSESQVRKDMLRKEQEATYIAELLEDASVQMQQPPLQALPKTFIVQQMNSRLTREQVVQTEMQNQPGFDLEQDEIIIL